jgi:hypothetical protein
VCVTKKIEPFFGIIAENTPLRSEVARCNRDEFSQQTTEQKAARGGACLLIHLSTQTLASWGSKVATLSFV